MKLGREHPDIQRMLELTQKSIALFTIGVPEEDRHSMWPSFLKSSPKRTCVHDMYRIRNPLLQHYFEKVSWIKVIKNMGSKNLNSILLI